MLAWEIPTVINIYLFILIPRLKGVNKKPIDKSVIDNFRWFFLCCIMPYNFIEEKIIGTLGQMLAIKLNFFILNWCQNAIVFGDSCYT